MTIGQAIKRVRKELGLSQTELAELAGVARPTLSEYENDVREANWQTFDSIRKALGVKVVVYDSNDNVTLHRELPCGKHFDSQN